MVELCGIGKSIIESKRRRIFQKGLDFRRYAAAFGSSKSSEALRIHLWIWWKAARYSSLVERRRFLQRLVVKVGGRGVRFWSH
jgi:hypothetical protein